MFLPLLDSSYEFYYAYHGFKATFSERKPYRGPHRPRQDFAVLAPLPQECDGMWKPKGGDLVVLGLCEDYAKGLL